MSDAGSPTLHGGLPRSRGPAASAVLVLHGGRETSEQVTAGNQLAVLRMLDMYVGLRRQSSSAAVYLLRYRVRGWNADPAGRAEPAPVADARWAIDRIVDRHGAVPVVLLGHSMGGRTAFAVADDARVVGVCTLAPWLPAGEPLPPVHPDQRLVIAHGAADRTTSPTASLNYAQRLRAAGASAARFELAGGRHSLLENAVLWHRFAVGVSLGLLGDGELPSAVAAALDDASSSSLTVPLQDSAAPRRLPS